MATLLLINSSPKSNSVSAGLTRQFAQDWQAKHPTGRVVERNLSTTGLPLIDEAWITAAHTPPAQRSPEQKALLALSDQLIDEILEADVILLGVPMHNFFVPAALKAWIDQIARVGKTFAYSERGPKGLVPGGKKLVAVITRGGVVASSQGDNDPLEAYLRQILSFIGLTDLSIVHADRQGMGAEASAKSVAIAMEQVRSLARNDTSQHAV